MLTSLSFAAASLLLFSAVAPVKADDQWTAAAPAKHGKSDWPSSDDWSHRPKQWSGEWQPQHWSSKEWHSTHWPSNDWSGRKEWSTNQWSTSEWSHREKDGWSDADGWSHDGWSNTHSDKWSGEWDGRDGHGRDGHGKDGQWSHTEWNDHNGAKEWSEDWPSHRPSHHDEWSSQGWDGKKDGHHEWSDSWSRQSSPDDPPVCPSIEFEYFITPLAVKFTALCDTEMNWADVHINVLNKGEAHYPPDAPVENSTWQWNYRMKQIRQNKFRFEFTKGANGMNFDPKTQLLQFFFTYSPEQEHSDCNTQSFIFHPKKH